MVICWSKLVKQLEGCMILFYGIYIHRIALLMYQCMHVDLYGRQTHAHIDDARLAHISEAWIPHLHSA
jgi:hypothetical protein